MRHRAEDIATDLRQILRENERVLGSLAQRPKVRALDPNNCDPILDDYISLHPEYTQLASRDLEGNIVCSALRNPIPKLRTGEFPWFDEGARAGKYFVGGAFMGRQVGRWVAVLTYPIRDDQGKVAGVLALPLDLQQLHDRMNPPEPTNDVTAVFDRPNRFLMRSVDHERWVGHLLPAPPDPGADLSVAQGQPDGFVEAARVDGVSRLWAFVTLPESGWRVFSGVPTEEVFGSLRARLTRTALIVFGALLLGLLLAYRIALPIASPIRALAETSAKVASGDTTARAAVSGPREIRFVARQVNEMLDVRAASWGSPSSTTSSSVARTARRCGHRWRPIRFSIPTAPISARWRWSPTSVSHSPPGKSSNRRSRRRRCCCARSTTE